MKIKVNIDANISALLICADTDNDNKITVDDSCNKIFQLKSADGKYFNISGTYYLSNLLQELFLLKDKDLKVAEIESDKIFEPPVARISRMIKNYFWDGLTRTLDKNGIEKLLSDNKINSSSNPIIYIPHDDDMAFEYYCNISKSLGSNFNVVKLNPFITNDYVQKLNCKPGILSLALEKRKDKTLKSEPFIVPGGRFNEMYGWDSFFETLGLLEDGKIELAKSMVNNFTYEINHYGKILNANRSYYLTRSQPPFFTSMLLSVFKRLTKNGKNIRWLSTCLKAAIKEYTTVWMNEPKLTVNGLSRYYGEGLGIPPETEPNHFDHILEPYAEKNKITIRDFIKKYNSREIIEPKLDKYFLHDRSMRESGHDTSYRLINISASLNPVDLNSLLYKYEKDIEFIITEYFHDSFQFSKDISYSSKFWKKKSLERKKIMNRLLWDKSKGIFFDYNFEKTQKTNFESATSFYTLWAKLATQKQADSMVKNLLPKLEAPGGILSTSQKSRGRISKKRPQRQWDYPFGWAPHQIIIWEALSNYGYFNICERLAYKWLFTITKNAVDYNGTIPEKFDVVERTHKVFAEYGNVGTDFEYITREGFGWMNASYQIGQKYISKYNISNLNKLIPPEWIFH